MSIDITKYIDYILMYIIPSSFRLKIDTIIMLIALEVVMFVFIIMTIIIVLLLNILFVNYIIYNFNIVQIISIYYL